MTKQRIIIAGGTGLIGQNLTKLLQNDGHEVQWLSRSPNDNEVKSIYWNPLAGEVPIDEIRSFDVMINLAGAGIADKRWSDQRKSLIINSRTESNESLAYFFKQDTGNLKHYISASAIGIYGNTGDLWCVENQSSIDNSSFLVRSTRLWEKSITKVQATGIPTTIIRIGLVTSRNGGYLPKLLFPMRLGIAAYFGKGEQFYSWIHEDDICRMFQYVLEKRLTGLYNGVAPNPLRNKALVRQTKELYAKYALLVPAPEWALKIMLGEMASAVLNSNRVSTEKIMDKGFEFKFAEFDNAIRDILQ